MSFKKNGSVYRITGLVIATLKLISNSAAALKCLGLIGVFVLAPAAKGLGITHSMVGLSANLLLLPQKIYDNYLIYYNPEAYRLLRQEELPEEAPDLDRDWNQNMCAIAAILCSISSNLFGTLDLVFGPDMDMQDRMPGAAFRFWRTGAALSRTLENYIGY